MKNGPGDDAEAEAVGDGVGERKEEEGEEGGDGNEGSPVQRISTMVDEHDEPTQDD